MSAHKSGATLERNAKVPLKCKFYDVFLKVGVTVISVLSVNLLRGKRGRIRERTIAPL